MEIFITDYPNSYAKIKLEKDESIIAEKGSFILSDGEFIAENKLELSSYKNLIAKIGGKSFTYANYKALLAFILFLAKIIKLEDLAEKSELLAIILVLGIIGLPMYIFLQELLNIKN